MIVGAFAILALAALHRAQAQTTNATCLSTYAYLYNSRGQSPCLVAAYAGGACNVGTFNVPALALDYEYFGPDQGFGNNCLCSSILYSLLSACGVCQSHAIITWSRWKTNCTTVYLSVYPEDIPSGTAIPAWAYLDISTSDIFNPAAAQALQSSPESTASLSRVTQSASGANPTQNGSTSTKSSNTGAIAGGVVGGVAVVALAAILILFLIRQRNNKARGMMDPSKQHIGMHPETPVGEKLSFRGGGGYAGQQQHMGATQLTGSTVPTAPHQRLHDPSSPSTFSVGPAASTFASHQRGPPHSSGVALAVPGTYRGMPEL
ncbi:hypothetical protein BD410DRAFT_789792 [Rickenella mellea]|uniref:Uncharacterized protein n=1 Tax=Rickenella mellea TaxID=50990 RepID=A0A4Y7Q3B1_9AGAM|nr:hypothetical protein BD410DRAFT_789792 [Rickenella mellea]